MYEILYAHPRAAVGGNTPRSYGMFSTMLRIALPGHTHFESSGGGQFLPPTIDVDRISA